MNKDLPSHNFIPPPIYYGYAPPPPPLPPPPPPPLRQNVMIGGGFGSQPRLMICPHCGIRILSEVETETTITTHAIALFLCIIGFWCCAPIPYCMDNCLRMKHYCPLCKSFLGQSNN
ncbi:cell death-inducing p53-target protein 1-like isoform X2 [Vespa mandarinia]|uniref:cell death-inducing p53-target protein 1-like isoform X2 n=1 Tax=Vespa mandarinia TaxID=7446 RepID=UPI00160B519D|nr:cell death-inducing p53-target protein 1-like isoform X2 [Vespa mandarinia]